MSEQTCAHCGGVIVNLPVRPGATSTAWFHDRGNDSPIRWERACGWAEPREERA